MDSFPHVKDSIEGTPAKGPGLRLKRRKHMLRCIRRIVTLSQRLNACSLNV